MLDNVCQAAHLRFGFLRFLALVVQLFPDALELFPDALELAARATQLVQCVASGNHALEGHKGTHIFNVGSYLCVLLTLTSDAFQLIRRVL